MWPAGQRARRSCRRRSDGGGAVELLLQRRSWWLEDAFERLAVSCFRRRTRRRRRRLAISPRCCYPPRSGDVHRRCKPAESAQPHYTHNTRAQQAAHRKTTCSHGAGTLGASFAFFFSLSLTYRYTFRCGRGCLFVVVFSLPNCRNHWTRALRDAVSQVGKQIEE